MSTLLVGVPSKGRLQENAHAFFARAGMSLVQPRGGREYRGTIPELHGVEVVYLSAAEITSQLAQGGLHFGVTGEDLLREMIADADARVLLVDGLGCGNSNFVFSVPQAWIDVGSMHDLAVVATALHATQGRRMRVATNYVRLTRTFFARHGLGYYRIVQRLGAPAGAPATGAAELIVDITTTGATLAANGLKVLDDGVMLRSQANLVASLAANWGERERAVARALLDRVAAERHARTMREVRTRFPGADAEMVAEMKGRFGVQAPLGGPTSSGMLTLLCAPDRVHELAIFLREAGAETVMVASPEYVVARENALYGALVKRLDRKN
jgi:ATP phosphoribosyltransferase